MTMHLRSGSPLFRSMAVLTALCFFNLEMAALMKGSLALSEAHASGKVRRIGLFVLPASGSVEDDAQVVQTLMRERVAGLSGVQLLTGSPEPNVNLQVTVAPKVEEGASALAAREPAAACAALYGSRSGAKGVLSGCLRPCVHL